MSATLAQHGVHILHCIFYLISVLLAYKYFVASGSNDESSANSDQLNFSVSLVFIILKLLPCLATPRLLMNAAGLLLHWKCYHNEVKLKTQSLFVPFLCFRVVTRGNFPNLVRSNVEQNVQTCLKIGLENFLVEVVTDKPIHCPSNYYVRETVVPFNYKPRSGAKYKAKALQYCLEDAVNVLKDEDWIVHLDEESLLTENSVRGILNFVMDGRYSFGQGLVTYNHVVVNEITTLMDAFRVSDDLGTVRGQFKLFHRPIFGWKGSFCVCQVAAERHVSFDHGWAGSVAEDLYFSLVAYKYGYRFEFIEGEIVEKSPFTLGDFLRQRKRWFEGQLLVVLSPHIPLRFKIFALLQVLGCALSPLVLVTIVLEFMFTCPHWFLLDLHHSFVTGSVIFFYSCGVIKSHVLYPRRGLRVLCAQLFAVVIVGPLIFIYQCIIPLWSLWSNRIDFYVVEKEIIDAKTNKFISFVQ